MEKFLWVDANCDKGTEILYVGEDNEYLRENDFYTVEKISFIDHGETEPLEYIVYLQEVPNVSFKLNQFRQRYRVPK